MEITTFDRLISPLFSERGEVGAQSGTATKDLSADPTAAKVAAQDTGNSEAGATAGDGSESQAKEESFIDPSQLPEELKPHWKRMHRAYTKKLESIKSVNDKAAMIDRFNSDPEYAIKTIQQKATELGYSLTKAQAAQAAAAAGGNAEAPQHVISAVEATLPQELKWLAKSIANAQWASHQITMKPLQEQSQKEKLSQRAAQYEEMAEALTEAAPGWEEHEEDMVDLLKFLNSETMTHKKFGSKLNLLYNMVTGNAQAVVTAIKRQGEAAKNRTVSGQNTRSSAPNLSERIRGAKNLREAIQIGAKAAEEELTRAGHQIR